MPDRSLLLMQPCNEFNNDYNRFRPRRVQSRFLEPLPPLAMTPFLAKLCWPFTLPSHGYDTASAAGCVTFDSPILRLVLRPSSGELTYPTFLRRRITGYRVQRSDRCSSFPKVSE